MAEETAKLLKRGFNRRVITPEEYFNIVPYVMENMEQPLGDASAIAFAIGCRAAAEKADVCYSGEGADEFFGGYNMYRNAERYGDNLKDFYVGNTNIMKEDEKKRILKHYDENILPIHLVKDIYEETEDLDPLAKMSNVDIQIWLEGDIYLNVDKMSKAAGLEIRMPLTDRRIFDIASRMPSKYKVNEEQTKWLSALRRQTCCRKKLPSEKNWDLLFRYVSGWQMNGIIRMYKDCLAARLQKSFSMLMKLMRFLMIMLAEIQITGEKCGPFIRFSYGMKYTLVKKCSKRERRKKVCA